MDWSTVVTNEVCLHLLAYSDKNSVHVVRQFISHY